METMEITGDKDHIGRKIEIKKKVLLRCPSYVEPVDFGRGGKNFFIHFFIHRAQCCIAIGCRCGQRQLNCNNSHSLLPNNNTGLPTDVVLRNNNLCLCWQRRFS